MLIYYEGIEIYRVFSSGKQYSQDFFLTGLKNKILVICVVCVSTAPQICREFLKIWLVMFEGSSIVTHSNCCGVELLRHFLDNFKLNQEFRAADPSC